MLPADNQQRSGPPPDHFQRLTIIAALLALIFAGIALLSPAFEFDATETARPLLLVIGLFTAAFLLYAVAIRWAREAEQTPRLLALIIGAAIVFRATMLFSVPIQEVDIYRYIWDGVVSAHGISPFRYPPDQVELTKETPDLELARLLYVRDHEPGIAETLRRVHFGELPTIYPPTSQAVFYAAAVTTPLNASVQTRLRIMKLWLLAFDVGIIALLIRMLSLCQMPTGLVVAYAWCPLVMKEVANSGHLDTIAVFLAMWVVYRMLRVIRDGATFTKDAPSRWTPKLTAQLTITAMILAAAVGAKLYPIVLGPLVLLVSLRRFGWQNVALPGVAFVLFTALLLQPMMPGQIGATIQNASETESPFTELPPSERVQATDPSLGVQTFLKHWEMNDFLFTVIIENLKAADEFPQNRDVWFSVVPDSLRRQLVDGFANAFSASAKDSPFLITRCLTSLIFLGLAFWWAWKAASGAKGGNEVIFCRYAFLTLAWFWLLSPTQNPWYWLWALPLLPFMRNQAWYAMAGIAMVYYFRFWLEYHRTDVPVLFGYPGTDFFDFVVTWVEFVPWFIWLSVAAIVTRRNACGSIASVTRPTEVKTLGS